MTLLEDQAATHTEAKIWANSGDSHFMEPDDLWRSSLPKRLADLQVGIRALIAELAPAVVAVEQVFFQVNVRTAMAVGQASGIVMAEAHAAGAEVVQYTPNQVKDAVAGYGAASKEQMGHMVQTLLGLAQPPSPVDAADAAALALCHLAHAPMRARVRA